MYTWNVLMRTSYMIVLKNITLKEEEVKSPNLPKTIMQIR